MKAIMFPGQGSQYKGMGRDLFTRYKTETQQASDLLGYDLQELCVADPHKQLSQTQFTQPALYVVNALGYAAVKENVSASFFVGHSLGEYNALLAAGVFDFITGLKLVRKRGELMAEASGGGMAAVVGVEMAELKKMLDTRDYEGVDIANFNTPSQIVIAGKREAIKKVVAEFEDKGIRIIPLQVSAAFHSRYMAPAAADFEVFLKDFEFSAPSIPVISNALGIPYEKDQTARLLSTQIASPVQWTNIIRFLMGKGVIDYQEIGSSILSKMVHEIREKCSPILGQSKTIAVERNGTAVKNGQMKTENENSVPKSGRSLPMKLGSKLFRDDYRVKYAYVTGAMYRGIASRELVVKMGKAGMLGYLGTGGLPLEKIEADIQHIQNELKEGQSFGLNLLHSITDPSFEMDTVKLYLRLGVKHIEAAAYMQMTESLVYFRLSGLLQGENKETICRHKILGKISRPEVAEEFMRPAPEKIVNKLLREGLITAEQAELSKTVPMSYDICVEADSGGHTDGGVALVLLPSIQRLRTDIQQEYQYQRAINVGLAGGIGTPQAIACAFVMGADFVLTGSINQCTVEANMSDYVKDLLQEINVQDTAYAPAGDMFEIGSKVQVLKKGVLFPARANKLYALYTQYNALHEIPEKTVEQLERNYFKKPIPEIWEETITYFKNRGEHSEIQKAEQNPRHKMALVFRWYFGYSMRLSLAGNKDQQVNFQVHCGPALGAFNQWVKGTTLESWRNRHVDEIGVKMMEESASLLESMYQSFKS